MSTLALELIAKEKKEKTGKLDLGNCDLTELPVKLFELAWLEELTLSNSYYDYEKQKRIHSQNKGKENKLESIHKDIIKLQRLKTLHCSGDFFNNWNIQDIAPLNNLTKLEYLDLNSNQIQDIAPLNNLTNLQYLYLDSNQIQDIAPLNNLPNLQYLDLDSNQIQDITVLNNLTNLQELDLSSNPIQDITVLNNLTKLQTLDLRNNQIQDITVLNNLTKLQSLNLSSNQIQDFTVLNNLTKLQSLNLSSNQIQDFTVLNNLTNLQSLNLSSNQIQDFTVLNNLTKLQSLHLSSNQIQDITVLNNLPKLQSLNLNSNQIQDITALNNLPKLQSLNLNSNQIQDITALNNLPKLQSLNLNSNQIQDITALNNLPKLQSLNLNSNQIQDITVLNNLPNLQSLNLSSNQIQDITVLNNLTKLQSLYLSSNQIQDITVLNNLTNLQILVLINNQIQDISVLNNLTKLQSLHLSSNQIQDFTVLNNLANLQSLDLTNNQIQDISVLNNLTNLQSLDLTNNQIQDITVLNNLTNLQELDLSSNQIQDITVLNNLTNLQTLNLSSNQIQNISPLKHLLEKKVNIVFSEYQYQAISIKNNPLKTPPPEIVKEGREAVLKYFQELEEQGSTQLYEAKMLVVGEGGVGKTTLIEKLKNRNAAMPEESDTTKGIDIHQLEFKTKEGNDFTINMWDFGGQEIYHSTHQFFLTKRSLYILVDDTRKDDKTVHDASFNYWLQTVDLFGAGSPMLIVQNEKGDRSKDLDIKGMQARFGEMIKDRFPTNLKTQRGLDKVKEAIIYHIQQLPHVGHTLPKKWAEIRLALIDLETKSKVNHISLDKYYEICAAHGIKEKDRAKWLSRYLHDLGMFLHFQNEEDGFLKKTIILNNEWATEAVYKVIDDEKVKKKYGRFKFQEAKRIWHESQYSDMYEELLELMNRFELCYELKDSQPRMFLVPQLLPVTRCEYKVNEENNLHMHYRFDFMPKGFLNRFTVRVNRLIQQPELTWRSGVILEKDNTQAEIIETYGKQEVTIRVAGDQRKALMTVISDEFDELHRQFEGLKVTKLIPCYCDKCQQEKVPYLYEFKKLAKRKMDGRPTVECEVSYEQVNVLRLIDDVLDIPILAKREITKEEEKRELKYYFQQWSEGKFPAYKNGKERIAAIEASMERVAQMKATEVVKVVESPKVEVNQKCILVVAANPSGPKLRLDTEVRNIEEGLKLAGIQSQYKIISKGAVRVKDLRRAIHNHKPLIVQFSGHGDEDGQIILEDDNKKPLKITPTALGNFFKIIQKKHQIKCVFLNACYSDIVGKEIVKYVPFVIGMNSPIPDRSAIVFSEAFYDAICDDYDVEYAFELAVNAIEMKGYDDEHIPILLKQESN